MKSRQTMAIFLLLALLVGESLGFLATKLNASDPDVAEILCPEQMVGETRDHKWITREGVRRNLRRFFLEEPPSGQPDFNVPSSASLTELYHAYYGAESSAARFIKAVNSIAAANVKADSASQLRYDPSIQGDGESLSSMQQTLATRYPQLQTSIMIDEAYPAARSLLGLSLHSIQKFYSHSTWIELGNKDIIPDLGLPGFEFSHLADATEDVCTPCANSQGTCMGNVLGSTGLSSGYYTYDVPAANGILIPKPAGSKCSHGGVLDESSTSPAEGGINKDTTSPCFSPHHYLHEEAVELAVQATDHYLSVVHDAVGSEKYRQLLDLYHGSALSIAIDTTGSMGDDIDAVKQQVKLIVENTAPELYILAPFHDPGWGPGLRTTDATEFLDAVMALHAGGGAGGLEERFWNGLQLALSLTPDYGDIFTFTDAGGNDGELMESDIARAQKQNNKVSVIYSGKMSRENSDGLKEYTTGVDEYKRLADSTGGLFIPSNKFDIDAITPILGEGVESADVEVTLLKELSGPQDIDVPIDDSIFDFEIRIAGDITSGLLLDITGTEYDLMDQSGLEATSGVEVVVYTSSLKSIRWTEPRYGMWSLHLDSSSSSEYSVTVSANSTLSFLGGFAILDPSPPHPHYMLIVGRPLLNTIYYLEITLIGYLESDVTSVSMVEYVDTTGKRLREIEYTGDVDDEFYIRSEPLPDQPFYVKLYGRVQSGNQFTRLLPVLMSPVEASVEVLASSEDLAARPGESTEAEFLVTNFGLDSYFAVTGTDDDDFLVGVNPERIYLPYNSSSVVVASFSVPSSATPGTFSWVTVTAQSEYQAQSVNSASDIFRVLPLTTDTKPPTCEQDNVPDCTGFNLNGICSQKNWTVSADFQDNTSGLSRVDATPVGLSTVISKFDPGTTDVVSMTYWASCCTSQVELIGVDVQGNIGKCQIDMGVLGGLIFDLEVESVGVTWVELVWSITPSDYEIHKYSLLINNDFNEDIRCKELTCHYNVTYLEPCSPQTFQLTPIFSVGGEDRSGATASTDAFTDDAEPGPPMNGIVDATTNISAVISWEVVNRQCVSLFEVCYRPFGFTATEICERTSSTSYEMRGLEACAVYEAKITSLSPTFQPSSDSLYIYINTDEVAPGAPRNMKVAIKKSDSVTITWEDPLDRAQCIERYVITYKITDKEIVVGEMNVNERAVSLDDTLHTATIYPLVPCTNYTFDVYAVSKSNYAGPYAQRDAATEETEPGPVTLVDVDQVTEISMHVLWESEEVCLDHYLVCYYNDYEVGNECLRVKDKDLTMVDLLPCTKYHVSVSKVTPSGFISNETKAESETLEDAPGEPQNLALVKETSHAVDIRYDPPIVNTQCTVEYDHDIINLDMQAKLKEKATTVRHQSPQPRLDAFFHDLSSCTNYQVKVRALSATKLASEWVILNSTTKEDLPSAPQNLEVMETTQTTINIRWWHPMENNQCTWGYYLEWSDSSGVVGGRDVTPSSPDGPLPSVIEEVVEGLTLCTEYQFSVEAVTQLGNHGPPATIISTTQC